MANNLSSVSPVKLVFDPAVEGGTPYLIIEPNLQPVDTSHQSIRLTAYALDPPEIIVLDTQEVPVTPTTKYILPHRKKKEILGIRVELGNGSERTVLGEWRALYFPKGKLINYRGSKLLKRPPDFKQFWVQTRAELDSVPMEPELTPISDWVDYHQQKQTSQTGRCYRVKLNSFGGIPIVCYYMVPNEVNPLSGVPSKKKYPAIQIMPGWGAEELPNDRTAQGIITLSVNPRTHGPSKQYFTTPIDQHHLWNITEPKEYYYRQAYMDCLRALDFLVSRPEVDKHRIGLQGGSQGGAFALATAALSPYPIAAVVSNVTYLSNFPDFVYVSTNGSGPTFGQFYTDPNLGDKVRRTLSYIDVANLAPWIQSPTLVCVALQDRVCPPVNGIVALNRIPKTVPKRLVLVPGADHEITDFMRQENEVWQKKYLKY
ncbi:MAG: acetylxylan esterase [bacterium]|nr:acetylxylan esterase [bacterium]